MILQNTTKKRNGVTMPRFCIFGEILPRQKPPSIQNNPHFSRIRTKAKPNPNNHTTPPPPCQNNPNKQNRLKPSKTEQNLPKPTQTHDSTLSLVSTFSCFFFFFFFSCIKRKYPRSPILCLYGFCMVLISFAWFCRSHYPHNKNSPDTYFTIDNPGGVLHNIIMNNGAQSPAYFSFISLHT